jgi:hypothetical protein
MICPCKLDRGILHFAFFVSLETITICVMRQFCYDELL